MAVTLVTLTAQSLAWAATHFAYARYYNFIPGQYTGYRLQELRNLEPRSTCLILGASTAREGFDIAALEARFPETRFLTLATTAGHGAIWVVDVQSQLLPVRPERYKCIIVGMHPFFLYKFRGNSYDLATFDYASQLSPSVAAKLLAIDGSLSGNDLALLASGLMLPNRKHGAILKKHLLSMLYGLYGWVSGKELHNRVLANKSDAAKSEQTHILYKDNRRARIQQLLKRRIDYLERYDYADPESYRTDAVREVFVSVLQRLDAMTDRLILFDLPETPVFDAAISASNPTFLTGIAESGTTAQLYRCELPFVATYIGFVDSIHVDSHGREQLTTALTRILENKSDAGVCGKGVANISELGTRSQRLE
ncbi:MAG: hypothetical protein AAF732_23595 [Pseudomonadota bacterium]